MAWALTIGGVDQTDNIHYPSGVEIPVPWNERSTARFTCVPGFVPDMHDDVVIYAQDGTTPIFGGIIVNRSSRGLQHDAMLVDIDCVDYSIFMDWRVVNDGYVGTEIAITTSSNANPTTITTPIAHGLTTGDTVFIKDHSLAGVNGSRTVTVVGSTTFTIPVQGNGTGGTMQRTTVVSLKRVLEDLIAYYLTDYGITLASGQVDGPSGSHPGLTWKRKKVSEVLRDLSTYSGGYLWSISPTKVLQMALPGTLDAPFDWTASSGNLTSLEWSESSEKYATRIILVCGGTDTLATRQVWTLTGTDISNGYVETDVPSIPTGGVTATVNGTAVTIGGAGKQLRWDWATHRITPGTLTPIAGDVIALSYTAQYPFIYTEDSLDTPIAEVVIEAPDIKAKAPAETMAAGLIAEYHQTARVFTAQAKTGMLPGQEVVINVPGRDTLAVAVVTDVTIKLLTNETWLYTVTAVTGVYQGSPLDYFRGLGGGGSSVRGGALPSFTSGTNPTVGQALTKVDDTNVTLALGGEPDTALLAATSLTLGWTGSLAVSRGGTGLSSLTANRIPYGNGTSALQSSANLTFNGSTLAITGAGTFSTSVTTPILSSSGTLSIFPSGAATVQTGSGNLTLSPAGDIVLGPVGNDILPSSGYTKNLGALTNKYLTLHAAELWVETLVAQDTMATIGGRVLVGPTTTLTSDLTAVATSIIVKHNQMVNGDRVFMQANGFYEAMAITSGPSGSGPYTYSVTRNLDGSGANTWTAGDAVFNTGTTGDGFIDLYSINGLIPGSTAGPTIVGNVRTGTTYSDIAPRWAIGNLNGLYGYGTDIYGAAFGDNSNAWVKIDPTNGVRIGHNATTYVQVDASGNALFSGQVTIGTGRNMLANSEFRRESSTAFGTSTGAATGTDGPRTGMRTGATLVGDSTKWLFSFYNGTGSPVWSFLCNVPSGFPVAGGNCYLNCSSVAPSASSVKQVLGPAISIAAGQIVEFSFYGLVDGQTVQLDAAVVFVDASNISLGSGTVVDSEAITNGGTTTDLSTYGRAHVIATAPANTAYAVPIVQVRYAASPSVPNNAAITRMYFGYAQPGQTQPTPWAPGGVTLIDGSMLSTDMVLTNTLRGGSATALDTNTGFWLDASTSTPTFRVGDPSDDRIKWDGTNLEIVSAGLTIDSTGIKLGSVGGTVFSPTSAYRFDFGDATAAGLSAAGSGTEHYVVLANNASSVGSGNAYIQLIAESSATSALIEINAVGGSSQISMGNFVSIISGLTIQAFGAGTVMSNASGVLSVSSDASLKRDVRPFTPALDAVLGLQPVRFRWTPESGLDTGDDYVGFIAQEVQQVIPDAVGVNRDGTLTLQDRTLLGAVVNAIKELDERTRQREVA